jgi:ATP-dependent phosphoenolpyruvate carboxykinase
MNQTGPFNPAFGAEKFGFKDLKSVSYNFEAARLVEDAVRGGEAMVAKGGALKAETDPHRRLAQRQICRARRIQRESDLVGQQQGNEA